MEMKLHLNSSNTIIIQLVDSHLIHQWVREFCSHELEETETIMSFQNRLHTFDKTKFDYLYEKLQNGIAAYNGPVYNTGDKQHILNKLHHWCVEYVNSIHDSPDRSQMYHTNVSNLNILNDLCHQCESTLADGNRILPTTCSNPIWDQQLLPAKYIPLTNEWLDLLTTNKYDVYIAKRLLGKDYREAYRDNDDPTYNEVQAFGDQVPLAFEFDPINCWNDLYNSKSFIDFLPVDNTHTNLGRIPIGNIVNDIDNIHNLIQHDRIDKVTYNESI